ncbi:unnamed protein product (macronuclear) [Paramecium tetraurelia]|uniref:Uncharacterized protein n=1 Tax=Paramecium tetraurelia TaxID=5888 RepID=A0DZN9_PARTE|nr:uncharacterized protein GSPATT00021674001 [Paramecium tetraurelia]CAK88506.1 unnamed protein product [Paramecium tetraurelia]|eukprot:XP_001455903.1 hypothetical protein (macronuclear) [Paramecium tetraurelia strain d4-2]
MLNIINQGAQNAFRVQGLKKRTTIHVQKDKSIDLRKIKGKFVFEPSKTIQSQLDEFFLMLKKNGWDRKLGIKGFKGTFKVEHLIMIETKLRVLFPLRELTIVDTQMDREHLIILRQWLAWLQPKKLTLEFQQNEIDDQDFEEFIYYFFERDIDLKRLYIISNPGIYKGQLLKQLRGYLKEKNNKDEYYDYEMLMNKDSKSIAIIKLEKIWTNQEKNTIIQQAREKIDQTCFYYFNLQKCFTESNYQGFEHLIQLTYDLDNLEQICGLNASDNYLGTLNSFQQTCQHLSTAKGLLELKLKSQRLLDYSTTVSSLVGDRYDKLRVNLFDIQSNNQILEKTFGILSNEIFLHCKEVVLDGVLTQQLSTLYKLSFLAEAVKTRTDYLQQESIKCGKLLKHNFRKMNLSTVENYNRHDLVEKFLQSVIFTEHSNIKLIYVQNCDIGRVEAWTNTFRKFKERIIKEEPKNPLLKNYKLPLKTIIMPTQTYRMEPQYIKRFFYEFFFTKKGEILETKTFYMESCFKQNGREEGIVETCEEIYKKIENGDESMKNVEYTIKNVKFKSTTCDFRLSIYKCLILTDHFKLEELIVDDEGMSETLTEYKDATYAYFQKQPSGFIHSLNSLQFISVQSITFEIYEFLELFVYHDQLRLKKLIIKSLTFEEKNEQKENFEKIIESKDQKQFQLSIKELLVEQINEDQAQINLIKYVIFSKFQRIEKLSLGNFKLDTFADQIIQIIEELQIQHQNQQGSNQNVDQNENSQEKPINDKQINIKKSFFVFENLRYLSLSDIAITSQKTWNIIFQQILFNTQIKLQELFLHKINLDEIFIKALDEATKSLIDTQIKENLDQISDTSDLLLQYGNLLLEKPQDLVLKGIFDLQKLSFIECKTEKDVLTPFLILSTLNELTFKSCDGLNKSIQETQEKFNKNPDYQKFNLVSIQTLVFEKITLEEQQFQWFLDEVVFNKDRQQVKNLTFNNCNLNDNLLSILTNQIKKIKSIATSFRRYYNLRSINLQENPNISEAAWVDFFNKLMEQKAQIQLEQNKKEEKKKDLFVIQSDNEENEDDIDSKNVLNNKKEDQQQDNEDFQQKEDRIDKIAISNADFVYKNELQIKDKLINNFEIFKPSFPSNLQQVSINLEFNGIKEQERKDKLYYNIIVGLIINAESQVDNIKLTGTDLTMFMSNVQKAQQLIQILVNNCYKGDVKDFKSKIQKIEFNFKTATENDVKLFVKTFICSTHIQLKSLELSAPDNQGIISQILSQLPNRSEYVLETLKLNFKEKLTEGETFQFFEKVILGTVLPIKVLKLGRDISFSPAYFSELLLNQQTIPLEHYAISISDEEEQLQIHSQFLELLYQFNCKIKILDINKTKDMNKLLAKLIENKIQNQNSESLLEELYIYGQINVDVKFLTFLFSLLKNLKLLKLDDISLENKDEIENFFKDYKLEFQQRENSQLEVKKIKGDASQSFLENFVLNDKTGFSNIFLKSHELLTNFPALNNISKIKLLKLDMGLLYNSSTQLNEKALTLIGQKFIYNEESNCEDLLLYQLHLKVPGVKALTSPAQKFREDIEAQKRQSTCQLKLKTVVFYYSLYVLDEGHELLMKDLFFFEYINLERHQIQVSNFNNANCKSVYTNGKNWLKFQQQHNRQYKNEYPIKYIDFGRNEFVSEKQVWTDFLNFSVFSDQMPHLETFNMHFMAINDLITEYIVENALNYLNKKPKNFKLPVKKINFSQNNSLTKIGWQNIFENFFLHPKVDLIELNMISTMLDSQEKLDVIYNAFKQRADRTPSKKLPMQMFLCYNVTLKDMIKPYLSTPPPDYKPPSHLPVAIDYEAWKYGVYDGIPEEFGEKVLTYQRIFYQHSEFIETSKWKEYEDVKFAPYHLDFSEHYLKKMNTYFKQHQIKNPQIYLNLNTLKEFSSIFRYRREKPGKPFPYQIVFQNDTYRFLKSRESIIYKINLIQSEFSNLELISQDDVITIWKSVKTWKSSIDQIQIEYSLNDNLCEEMIRQGFSEKDIIQLVRIIPPKSIRIQGGLSLPAVKGLYSILYDTHYFQYSVINYGFDSFLNTGIGYALRETAYSYQDKNLFSNKMKKMFYTIFNFFVSKAQKFEFDDEIHNLNTYLSNRKLFFFLIAFNNVLFWAVTLISPFFFTHYYNGDTEPEQQAYYCVAGTSKEANYVYYGFAAFSALIEAFLFYQFQLQIPNHIEKLELKIEKIDEEQELRQPQTINQEQDVKKNQIAPQLFDRAKKTYIDVQKAFQVQQKKIAESKFLQVFLVLLNLAFSQLYKFDLFNDVVFILTCFYCDESILFILTLLITSITQGIYILQFLYLLYIRITQTDTTAKILSTKFINDIYQIAFLGRNQALSQQLDKVAPYNVSIIPNIWLTRTFLSDYAGRSMSNPIKAYFMQFMLEDMPQTALQAYFVVKQGLKQGSLNSQVIFIIVISIYNFMSSFYLFMSIRPSTLSQDDFDKLSKIKKNKYLEMKEQHLMEEEKQLKIYSELYSNPSRVASPIKQNQDEEHEQLL